MVNIKSRNNSNRVASLTCGFAEVEVLLVVLSKQAMSTISCRDKSLQWLGVYCVLCTVQADREQPVNTPGSETVLVSLVRLDQRTPGSEKSCLVQKSELCSTTVKKIQLDCALQ